jgi:hypothetical protein
MGLIEGKHHDENLTTRRKMDFSPGDHVVVIEVHIDSDKAHIIAKIKNQQFTNDETFVDWSGPVTSLSLPESRLPPNERSPSVQTSRKIEFKRVILEILAGQAALVRSTDMPKLESAAAPGRGVSK